MEDLGSFRTHAHLLDKDIREQGAKTVFYMTWADKSRPRIQKIIADAYSRIAVELGAVLAPVGLAWEKAQAQDVKLNFHHIDNRHANPSGGPQAVVE